MFDLLFTSFILQNIIFTNFLGINVLVKQEIEKPIIYNIIYIFLTIILFIPIFFINKYISFIPIYLKYSIYIIIILLGIYLLSKIFKKNKDLFYYLYINSSIYGIILININQSNTFLNSIINVLLSCISFVIIYFILNINKNKLNNISLKLIFLGIISLIFSRILL